MGRDIKIRTRRLIIEPMSDLDLQRKIVLMMDADDVQAYTQMLQGSEQNPKQRLWYIPWRIRLRREDIEIGDIGFKGPQKKGVVEIGYQTFIAYQGQGYMQEALRAMVQWAFDQPDVYSVEAETLSDNAASQRILEKQGFRPLGMGEEGPRYRREKSASIWLSTWICIGIGLGISVGSSRGNTGLGLTIGTAIGAAIGAMLDASEKKRRRKIVSPEEEVD